MADPLKGSGSRRRHALNHAFQHTVVLRHSLQPSSKKGRQAVRGGAAIWHDEGIVDVATTWRCAGRGLGCALLRLYSGGSWLGCALRALLSLFCPAGFGGRNLSVVYAHFIMDFEEVW